MQVDTAARTSAFEGNLHSPTPRKPGNPAVLRAQSEDPGLRPPNGVNGSGVSSGLSSGRSTPVPENAPPSVHAASSARKQVRAAQKHRLFPTIEYAARVSHFDKRSEHHDFRGFFILFWIGLAIMVITAMARNYKETGQPLLLKQWELFTANIWELAIIDFLMTASTMVSLPLHRMFASGNKILRWNRLGMWIQSGYQAVWLWFWCTYPFIREWSWTAQVFFTLHLLSLFMKMHSYAFYNGHLSVTRRRLAGLDKPNGESRSAAIRYPKPGPHVRTKDEEIKEEKQSNESLEQLRQDLAMELASPLGHISYPDNLTVYNFIDYLFCPTLCYELEYPRTSGTDYFELSYKTLAIFGCIFLMVVTSEEFILPVLDEASSQFQNAQSISDSALILLETISRLLFPFMVDFLLVFLVIFEYVLGAFAELTCFADRLFYADWWNSCDWLEFSREWNKPVHHFLNRHVYSASRGAHFGRPAATLLTFLISALAHELVMGCITKKVRGYGFVAMMLQMPIVMVQRSKWVRGRTLLNNVLFWCSMILGLSMMCALYVLV